MPFGNVKLNDGNEIPAIAFGTGSTMKFKDVTEYVEQALENGFSHIDTAAFYQTEKYVGKALLEEGLDRNEVYITTKYDGGVVSAAFEASRRKLGLKQIDLYLIHFPRVVFPQGLENVWREFENLKDAGSAKSIGVSNFNIEQLQDLLKIAKINLLSTNFSQIPFHPYNWKDNKELLDFSNKHGIVTEAYSALTPITKSPGGPVDPVLKKIADRNGATPAQVILSWVKSKGVVIVTTTTKKSRLQEYLDVADLPDLTEEEIAEIEEAGAKGPPSYRKMLTSRVTKSIMLSALWALFLYRVGNCLLTT